MRIGFAGTPQVAAQVLSHLVNTGQQVELVITKPDVPKGRGKVLAESEVSSYARAHGLNLIKPANLDSPDLIQLLHELELDLFIVVAYGNMIPAHLLDVTKFGWFNLHFSLLPRFRGAAPVQHTLLTGETQSGVTLFKIQAGMDDGPIHSQIQYNISDDDDAQTMLSNLAEIGTDLIDQALSEVINGKLVLRDQNHELATYASKLQSIHSKIDWHKSAMEIRNLVRATAAGPSAFSNLNDKELKIHRVRLNSTKELMPGQIVKRARQILVGTGGGDLELLEVQPSGKQRMSAFDWFNGLRDNELTFK